MLPPHIALLPSLPICTLHYVSAARLFFEYAVGRLPQMVIDTGESAFRDYLDQVRRVVLGDEAAHRDPLSLDSPSRS